MPKSKTNKLQLLTERRTQAMPEVKALIKKYGRPTLVWCINQLRAYEKKLEQLSNLKAEARKLEKEIR